jgi:pimeloyl-ACP methyl ester carboxylesterase
MNFHKIGHHGYFLALVLIVSCQRHNAAPQITVEQFVGCFLSPVSCVLNSPIAASVPQEQWDSLACRAVRMSTLKSGVFATILKDSSDVEYTLGYTTPSAIRTDTTYPLIIYLHGGNGSPLSTKGEKAYDMLLPLADTFNLFLASPSANRFSPWWSPSGIGRILQTLRFMTLHYPINPDKVFLAGVSDGATGCYAAANTIPSPFAGFIAVSGFGGMLPAVGMTLIPSNIMQRPIYNVNAGKDRIYDIAQVNKFLDWLVDQGVPVERKEYPDELHGFDYRAKEFGTIARYIRTWSKPKDKPSVNWTTVAEFPNCADNLIGFIPDNSSSSRHITAFWKTDTLAINAAGLREAVLSFPSIDKETIVIRMSNKQVRSIHALPGNTPLSFGLMMHSCFPVVSHAACYRIQF